MFYFLLYVKSWCTCKHTDMHTHTMETYWKAKHRQGWKLVEDPSPSCCRLTPGHSNRSPGRTGHVKDEAKFGCIQLRPKGECICRCMYSCKTIYSMYMRDLVHLSSLSRSLFVFVIVSFCLSVQRVKGLSRSPVCLCAQCADSRPVSLLSQPDQSNQPPTLPDLALTPVM